MVARTLCRDFKMSLARTKQRSCVRACFLEGAKARAASSRWLAYCGLRRGIKNGRFLRSMPARKLRSLPAACVYGYFFMPMFYIDGETEKNVHERTHNNNRPKK